MCTVSSCLSNLCLKLQWPLFWEETKQHITYSVLYTEYCTVVFKKKYRQPALAFKSRFGNSCIYISCYTKGSVNCSCCRLFFFYSLTYLNEGDMWWWIWRFVLYMLYKLHICSVCTFLCSFWTKGFILYLLGKNHKQLAGLQGKELRGVMWPEEARVVLKKNPLPRETQKKNVDLDVWMCHTCCHVSIGPLSLGLTPLMPSPFPDYLPHCSWSAL